MCVTVVNGISFSLELSSPSCLELRPRIVQGQFELFQIFGALPEVVKLTNVPEEWTVDAATAASDTV